MNEIQPREYLDAVQGIALEAGRRILDIYERDFVVTEKPDHSPVTDADHVSQEFIIARLSELIPGIPVLAEEAQATDFSEREHWQHFWLVDPLDGTKEFVNRNGEFTVNIALVERGRPILGVIYAPATGMSYAACVGAGASKQKGTCERVAIKARTYRGTKPMVAASRSHGGGALATFLSTVGAHDVVQAGSAIKFCLVAEGTADVYPRLGTTMEWDTAAGQCILEQAGGRVTDLTGQPLTYNKPTLKNPWFVASGTPYDWTPFLGSLRG